MCKCSANVKLIATYTDVPVFNDCHCFVYTPCYLIVTSYTMCRCYAIVEVLMSDKLMNRSVFDLVHPCVCVVHMWN